MSLEEAVYEGDLLATKQALRGGVNVNERGTGGLAALMVAAGRGHAEIVELLLAAGADPHLMEASMGATALHKAAQGGNENVIRLLINHGAFVDQQSPILGNTPLIDAVLHRHESAVNLLLEHGAHTFIVNHWQQSALQLARADGLASIALLIETHDAARAHQLAELTLIAAVKAGDSTEFKRLIEAGADINQRIPILGSVEDDYTPLGVAVRQQQAGMVRELLDAGADPDCLIGLMRGTVMHEAGFFGFSKVVNLLLEHQKTTGEKCAISLGAQGPYNGFTALHDAVWHGHLDTVRLLISSGAPLFARNHSGLTARELALQYGFNDVATALECAERVSDRTLEG